MSVKTLHLTPLKVADLSAGPVPSPLTEAIEDFPELLACIDISQVHKGISNVHITILVDGKIYKVIESPETCSVEEFQESRATEIVGDVLQHHGGQLLNIALDEARAQVLRASVSTSLAVPAAFRRRSGQVGNKAFAGRLE
jgi:hypothetical protein